MHTVILAIILAQLSNAPSAPIWKLYPQLTCRLEEVQFCNFSFTKCSLERGEAVLQFNFEKKQVHSSGAKSSDAIEDVSFVDLPGDITGISTVYAGKGLYSFVKVTKAPTSYETDTIDGYTQGPSLTDTFTGHLVCHP